MQYTNALQHRKIETCFSETATINQNNDEWPHLVFSSINEFLVTNVSKQPEKEIKHNNTSIEGEQRRDLVYLDSTMYNK